MEAQPPESFADRITHKRLRELYDFWQNSSEDGKPPPQKDIDLLKVPRLAPNIFIMDVLGDEKFRYRFMGTDIDRHLGASATGLRMDEFRTGAVLKTLTDFFGKVAETGRCGYLRTKMSTEKNDYLMYERLVMPISDDGLSNNKLLGGWYYNQVDDNSPRLKPIDTPEYKQVEMMSVIYEDIRVA